MRRQRLYLIIAVIRVGPAIEANSSLVASGLAHRRPLAVHQITDSRRHITRARRDADAALHRVANSATVSDLLHSYHMRNAISAGSVMVLFGVSGLNGQRAESLTADVLKYVRPTGARIILEHVEVIDGTGAAAVLDRNVTIEHGLITAIAPGADVPASNGTTTFDLRGAPVMPGIVGMHDHLWYQERPNLSADNTYDGPALRVNMQYSAPRLYLAGGVTTIRTTGSAAPYSDIYVKRQIEAGRMPGPHMDVTGPYLQGADRGTGHSSWSSLVPTTQHAQSRSGLTAARRPSKHTRISRETNCARQSRKHIAESSR
jgi:hypothetical protein